MLAKIVEKDRREYYSYVFAICDNGWNTAVIVFDNDKDEFSYVKMYGYTKGLTRSVFIFDYNEDYFVKDKTIKVSLFNKIKNVSGYDWLLRIRVYLLA